MINNYKNITVIGGGNIGTQFACKCASKGYNVNIYSSKPELYDGILEIVDENNNVITGHINRITSSIEEALENVNVIFITHPAFKLKETAKLILPYINKDIVIIVLPGTGGAEFAFNECIKKGAILAGLQRVPSVARLEKYGKRVRCEGLRDRLFVGSIPCFEAKNISKFIGELWNIPCDSLPNYLSVTLTPSNPILHTTRLCTLFRDYEEGKVYSQNPLFYGEWDNDSSELLISCDQELQNLCKALDKLDLSNVKSLKLHYESNNVSEMTKKLSSIKSLHNLKSPMIEAENGWIPDFSSRYFTADFPFGLAIIESFAKVLGVSTPNICNTIKWYRDVTGNLEELNISDYGLKTKDDIYNYYNN